MDIRSLVFESLERGLFLNAIFFFFFRRRLNALAEEARKSGGTERKRSPFVYNLR